MSRFAHDYVDTAVDRADDAYRDRRYMSGVMFSAACEVGSISSTLTSFTRGGRSIAGHELRALLSRLDRVAAELRESSRIEGV
jgi:hypothetical protein